MFARNTSLLFGVALIAAAVVAPVKADQWNKKTVITITEPVQMPSCCNPEHVVVLQPGTYVLALVDSLSDRHIVRVLQQDEKTVVTTILAIPNYRLQPTDKSTFQFWETPAGNPRAMRAWFYPGDNFGQEFAYPKMKSIEIARITRTPVPTVLVEKEVVEIEVLKTAPIVIVTEQGEEKPLVLIAQNTAAQSTPEAASQPQDTASTSEKTLPHTASSLPLMGLVGLASLGV